ncbi:ImmA/IrrE family metallo-endopeptidase [Microbacterium gilvum]|uniref:IrrE N-terminal-like domain-containing protein n=1 Tax=Microbacterium gilvum TaxID=1336204 RepID=A0ABP8ZPW6_9MICO
MHDLLKLAHDLGMEVYEGHGKHLGGYRPGENRIRIRPGLFRRDARGVLAHELGHVVLEHRPTQLGLLRKRQELAADEWAACYLIDRDRYAEVERLRDGHLASMAFDLDVVPELVRAYQRRLLRLGDVLYVAPRMGSGQWDEKHDIGETH